MTKKRKPAAGFRTSPPPCSAARWKRICKSMGKGYDRTHPDNVERTIAMIFQDYGRILDRMQGQCQKYRLGLAGNHVAHVICDEIDRIHGTPTLTVTVRRYPIPSGVMLEPETNYDTFQGDGKKDVQ